MASNSRHKSFFGQFLLTLAFGPLGVFYSSTPFALALCIIAGAISTLGAVFSVPGLFAVWVLSLLAGLLGVEKHNDSVTFDDGRHYDLLLAITDRSSFTEGQIEKNGTTTAASASPVQ